MVVPSGAGVGSAAGVESGGVSLLLVWVSLAGNQFAWGSTTSLLLVAAGLVVLACAVVCVVLLPARFAKGGRKLLPRRERKAPVSGPVAKTGRAPCQYAALGYGHLPVCMAKTQYSLSHDANLLGRPSGFTVPIREIRLSAGAGFVTPLCGEMRTMPGLPSVPGGRNIDIDADGNVVGLF